MSMNETFDRATCGMRHLADLIRANLAKDADPAKKAIQDELDQTMYDFAMLTRLGCPSNEVNELMRRIDLVQPYVKENKAPEEISSITGLPVSQVNDCIVYMQGYLALWKFDSEMIKQGHQISPRFKIKPFTSKENGTEESKKETETSNNTTNGVKKSQRNTKKTGAPSGNSNQNTATPESATA